MGYDMMLFVARGTCALLDAADAGGASLLGGLPMQRGDSTLSSSGGGGGDGRALDDLDAWMPPPDALLHAAKHEVGWDVMLLGVQHPAVLGAALCERAGRWEAAAALARGSLEVLHQALARIEAGRVLARAHAAVGDRAAAVAALDDATAEAAAAKYVLLETLVARDRLRLLLDGGAALKRERDAARDVLRRRPAGWRRPTTSFARCSARTCGRRTSEMTNGRRTRGLKGVGLRCALCVRVCREKTTKSVPPRVAPHRFLRQHLAAHLGPLEPGDDEACHAMCEPPSARAGVIGAGVRLEKYA